jgi:hypothetical protein
MPTVKWRELSDRNFLEYARFFGPQFIGALRPRQRRVAEVLAPIPEWKGGLGWNPKGLSVEERMSRYAKVIEALATES